MPDITITVGVNESKIILKFANMVGRTPREVIEQKINSWAIGQFNAYFIEKVNKLTPSEKIQILGDIE